MSKKLQRYDTPAVDVVETVHEGVLCTSVNTIRDLEFDFDDIRE